MPLSRLPLRARSPSRARRACAGIPRALHAGRCRRRSRHRPAAARTRRGGQPFGSRCTRPGPAGERVEHRTGVGAAPVLLELRDDLHRAHLRRSRDGACREGGAQQVERRDAGSELAGHLRDEMCDVREPLRLEEPLDLDRPGQADAREIVAAEVDEHHVLGAVLLRREEPLRVTVAGAGRSRDRVHRRAAFHRAGRASPVTSRRGRHRPAPAGRGTATD